MALGVAPLSGTVTGKAGADQSIAGITLSEVVALRLDVTKGVIFVDYSVGGFVQTLQLQASNLVTITLSTVTKALVLSTS